MEALPASPGTVARVAHVEFVSHVVSACVPGDLSVVERVFRPALRQDVGVAATMPSRGEPQTIQAVLSCGTKNCSSVTKAMEHSQWLYPTSRAEGAAKSILRRVADCASGCVEA